MLPKSTVTYRVGRFTAKRVCSSKTDSILRNYDFSDIEKSLLGVKITIEYIKYAAQTNALMRK